MNRPQLEELPGSFVVVFFRARSGELRCRVTDVTSHKTWIAAGPSTLWRLLVERKADAATNESLP